MPQSTMYPWINGTEGTLRLSTLSKLCDGLGVTVGELFGEDVSAVLRLSLLQSKLRAIRALTEE